jgi:ferredoxin-type protein NapF
VKRREFFSSLTSRLKKEKKDIYIFPPYFKDISDFEKCKECGDKRCKDVCEESIIYIEDSKPHLDFSKSGCTFCDECAKVCDDVLKVEYKKRLPVLEIDVLTCLAWHNTICSSCKDACLDGAIDFLGIFKPTINSNCTGCGFCVSVCPTNAIKIKESS